MTTQVTKIIEWDMGHRVPNHKSKCRNPHGHHYRLELTVSGPVIQESGEGDEGMVIDFGDIKKLMTEHVHDVVDHGFMVYEGDKVMMEALDNKLMDWNVIPVSFIPTAENIARWCYDQLQGLMPVGVEIVNVRLFETPNSWADYQPW